MTRTMAGMAEAIPRANRGLPSVHAVGGAVRNRAHRGSRASPLLEREDHRAGKPRLVRGHLRQVCVLDLMDTGLGKVVMMDEERQPRRRVRWRRRQALKLPLLHGVRE